MTTENQASGRTPFFTFRVLTRWDETYKVFIAECLESGNVVTADDVNTLKEMIVELIEDEAIFALGKGSLRNMFSHCADREVWEKWYLASTVKTEPHIFHIRDKPQLLQHCDLTAEIHLAGAL